MKHSVLFICLGNICRSPAAEGIMKHLVEERGLSGEFLIDSAGIGGWHVGQLPDRRMRTHGAAHGYRFDSRARQFAKDDFGRFDRIVTMDDDNFSAVSRMADTGADRRKVVRMADYFRRHPGRHDVPDPYYGGDRGFELVIGLLEDACEGLLDDITAQDKQTPNETSTLKTI